MRVIGRRANDFKDSGHFMRGTIGSGLFCIRVSIEKTYLDVIIKISHTCYSVYIYFTAQSAPSGSEW